MCAERYKIEVDFSKPLKEQPNKGHNRWHPDIPPILTVRPGDRVVIETLDPIDGQFNSTSQEKDVQNHIPQRIHPLTGPIAIDGAEPGDLLEVEILNVSTSNFGTSPIFPGFGLLKEDFSAPFMVKWEIGDKFATSREIPGVRIPGKPFMGVMGLAPSLELLREVNRREKSVQERGGHVVMPSKEYAVPDDKKIYDEGWATCAPHICGGNIDIKWLTKGSKLNIPVQVSGGLFSVGDCHFAQGDGEVCGTAIETAGSIEVRFDIKKGELKDRDIRSVEFECSDLNILPAHLDYREYYVTTGLPITREGVNQYEDISLAAKEAVRNMVRYLVNSYNYTPEQSYVLCSLAVDLKITECVDVPNYMVSAFLPLDIFKD